MWTIYIPFLLFSLAFSAPVEDTEVPSVEPEVLDELLENGRYEEFSKLLRIDNVNLVIPNPNSTHPMYNEGIPLGDILLTKEQLEQSRQGINFERYPGSKWPNGIVPYRIASSGYSRAQRRTITTAIADFNSKGTGVRFVPRNNEKDYVMIFSGNGCYSYLGRTGNQQPISLQSNGCVIRGIVQHEMIHAVGFTHEQNRPDRDEYVKILYENIPPEWQSQYDKGSSDDFETTTEYDYYSVMHYGVTAPGTGKRAFEVLKPGINEQFIGQRAGMTVLDVQKIRTSYS